jgi:hypothetical protein
LNHLLQQFVADDDFLHSFGSADLHAKLIKSAIIYFRGHARSTTLSEGKKKIIESLRALILKMAYKNENKYIVNAHLSFVSFAF